MSDPRNRHISLFSEWIFQIFWGDVKLSGVLGLYLGWLGAAAVAAGLLGAFVLAALAGLGLIAAGRATRKSRIPFGPFMLVSAIAVIAASGLAGSHFP